MHQGRVEIICGPMFSGKTEEVIRRLKRLKHAHQNYILFKPSSDIRYSETEVLTHEQIGLQAIAIDKPSNIIEILDLNTDKNISVVAIDEGQFITHDDGEMSLVKVCQELRERGYRVIITGLDMDFLGNPFKIMPELMAISDNVLKLTAICAVCQNEGTMTYRTSTSENTFELGSSDKYQAMCFKHWKEGMDSNWRKKDIKSE